MKILECKNLTKIYDAYKGAQAVKAINNLSFTVNEGDFIGIMGPSGSGKTTLLNILSGIDTCTSGEVLIGGKNITALSKDKLALFRRDNLGFIFQDFNLLDSLTVRENVAFPLTLDKVKPSEIEKRTDEILKYFDIYSIKDSYPYNISGGQKQRTAEARTLIKNPKIILADEPTGNLDSKSSFNVMESLRKINQDKNSTIVMVTHDPFAASFCKNVIFIKDGQIKLQIDSDGVRKDFYDKVVESQMIIGGEN